MSLSSKMHEWTPELGTALDQLRGPARRQAAALPTSNRGLLRVCLLVAAAFAVAFAQVSGVGNRPLGATVGALVGALSGFGAHRIAAFARRRRTERAEDASLVRRARR